MNIVICCRLPCLNFEMKLSDFELTNGEVSSPNTTKASSTKNVKPPVNLKTLFKAYRKAILVGDVDVAAQIESMIYIIEKERDQLDRKVLTLSAEISSGKEKLVRLQADFDNFRKRSEKERLTIRSDAQGEVIESLLPMVDNFERAKQQLKPETEMEKKINVSYQGIYKQFVEIMRSLRVSVVATVGKPFDPKLHEAIAREESQEYKEGIIIYEFRRGFLLGDRLLRPAMVKVSSGPGRKKTPDPSDTPAAVIGSDE
uniref:GrpE protein homolog n=1 Tax=Kalanchoe fedtschenkoi TaxID=63787 RepID=A0A7N0TK97_KALFE